MKRLLPRFLSLRGTAAMLSRAGRAATALLAVAMLTLSAQTAKADGEVLYGTVETYNTSYRQLVLKYGTPPSGTYYTFNGTYSWCNYSDKNSSNPNQCISRVTIDASCLNHNLTSLKYLFYDFQKITSIVDIANLKTEGVTDMSNMFEWCKALNSIGVSGFNTAEVTDMSNMFNNCEKLTSLDVSGWNTAKVTKMNNMFNTCSKLTSLNVSGLNTAAATTMSGMFGGCSSLSSLDLSTFNTAKVTDMSYMFSGCSVLTSLDLSNFNTVKVEDMQRMFKNCSLLTTIKTGEGWSIAAVTNHTEMFSGCTVLVGRMGTTCDGTNNIDKTYARADFGTVEPGYLTTGGLYATMSGTAMTVGYDFGKTDADAYYKEGTGFVPSTNNATATSVTLDATCASYNPTSLEYLFDGFTAATSITGLNNLNTANVTNMIGTFRDCQAVTLLDLSAWDTRNVTTSNNMTLMFKRCYELKTIIVGANWIKPYSSDMFTNSKKIVGGYGATTATNPATSIGSDNADTSETGYLTGLTRTLTAGGPDGEGKYWATFFNSAVGYTISGGEAFAGVYNSTTKKVELTSLGTDIPANTPVVICATGGTVNMTVDNTIAAYTGSNNLHGVDVQTTTPSDSYCLAIGNSGATADKAGFFAYSGANIPARRAYLTISGGVASAPSFIGFGDDENTTGIALPEASQDGEDGEVFDLNGRRISGQPQKGIYVKNGKKFVIK